jgi:predicted acyl esterase
LRFIAGRHDLPFYYADEVELQRSFLDSFLKGQDPKGWSVPGKLAPIDLLVRRGEPEVGNVEQEKHIFQRRDEWEWPLQRTQYERWYLTAEGGLSKSGGDEVGTKTFEYGAPE